MPPYHGTAPEWQIYGGRVQFFNRMNLEVTIANGMIGRPDSRAA